MRVIGDIVSNRCDLGFNARRTVQFKIVLLNIGADGKWQRLASVGADRRAVRVGQRAVVLDQAFKRLPGQVEAVEQRIAALQHGHHPETLGIVIEAAMVL